MTTRREIDRVAKSELLDRLGPKYLWWDFVGDERQREVRVLAQVMDLGTYEDIQAVEQYWSPGDLARILSKAQPGWISDRSWSFWLGRLNGSVSTPIAPHPPRRAF